MDFTREPIIETIITPREGHRLAVRSTKTGEREEYIVDAVEVVSFGSAFFFRSIERPKPFLVPAADFEVIEVKETRPALKNAPMDRTIKIGGGRTASIRREAPEEEASLPAALESEQEEEVSPATADMSRDRRRGARPRHRPSRRPDGEPSQTDSSAAREPSSPQEPRPPRIPFPQLIPPPTTLISDTLERRPREDRRPPEERPPEAPSQASEEGNSGESSTLSRVIIATSLETTTLQSGEGALPARGKTEWFQW